MPKVDGKEYPYTKKGKAAAAGEKEKKRLLAEDKKYFDYKKPSKLAKKVREKKKR